MKNEILEKVHLSDIKSEAGYGLKVMVQSAWGWIDVKIPAFIKLVEKSGGETIIAYVEIRKDGGATIKVPFKV